MRTWLAFASIVLLATPGCGASVTDLAWLTGCWREDTPEGYFEEFWSAAAAGTLLQTGRMVAGGKTVFFETLQVREEQGALSLLVTINGARQVRFAATERGPDAVVFRTPPDAPPETLSYRRAPKKELHVRLEKTRDGKPSIDEFHLKRVDCRRALSPRAP